MTVFAALWFMAAQHCCLEAAGLLNRAGDDEPNACCKEHEECAQKSCEVLRHGLVSASDHSVKAPAPQLEAVLSDLFDRLVPTDLQAEVLAFDTVDDSPPRWVNCWNFERRTALPPGAPSSTFGA